MINPDYSEEWDTDCLRWRKEILRGKYSHWCADWDGLPIDETCYEWPCACAEELMNETRT